MGSAYNYISVVMNISTAQGESVGSESIPPLTFIVEKEKITRTFMESTSSERAV